MKLIHKAWIALAILVLEISLWSVMLKVGGSSIGLLPQLFYGFLIGIVVSVTANIFMGKTKALSSIMQNKSAIVLILFAGLMNNAFTQLLLGIGTLGTNPSIGSIVYRSWVVIVILLTPLILRQRVNSKQLIEILIGFAGVYLIFSGGTLFAINSSEAPFVGILLLSGLCTAISALFMNKYTFDPTSTVVLFNIGSFIFIGLIIAATHTSLNVAFTPSSIIATLFLGIFGYGIGTSLAYYSYKILGPLIPGNAITVVPFLTILFSAILSNTPVRSYYILSAILISGGVLIQRRYSSHPERITEKGALSQLQIFDVTGAFANNGSYAISSHIAGGNRAFAIKLAESKFDDNLHSSIFSKYKCMAFTNLKPHDGARPEEIEFINDILGLKQGEIALIGIGDPKDLEASFEEFVTV